MFTVILHVFFKRHSDHKMLVMLLISSDDQKKNHPTKKVLLHFSSISQTRKAPIAAVALSTDN